MHINTPNQTTNPSQALTRPARLLRLPDVESKTGLKKSSIYLGIAAKTFPAPVRLLGRRHVAWHEAEIDAWIASRSRVGGVVSTSKGA